jgi:hypothetical protein
MSHKGDPQNPQATQPAHATTQPPAGTAARAGADPHASTQPGTAHPTQQPGSAHPDPYHTPGGPPDPKSLQQPGVQPLLTPTPATSWSTQMGIITGNQGGNVQGLIPTLQNGKQYCFIADVPFSAQASGSIIGVARLPVPFTMISITALASVSLATATMALGRADDVSDAGFWSAAATLTVTTPQSLGVYTSLGVPQYVGVDSLTGQPAGYQPGHQGGGGYDDIILTTGVAALPAAGGLRLFFEYLMGN